MRTDPPPSLLVASGTSPAASAAAEPPLDPPGERSVFHGLRVGPKTWLSVTAVWPNAGVLLLPMTIAPAALSRVTNTSSTVSGGASAYRWLPNVVRRPMVRARSLTSSGSPASEPVRGWASASASASSARNATTAFRSGLAFSIRSSASSTSRRGVTRPSRTAAASAPRCIGSALVTGGLERERDRVHAVAVTRRGLRGVVEEMAEVRVTGGAPHLRADHAEAAVLDQPYGVGVGGVVERWPAAVRVELRRRPEQLGTAGPAPVDADPLLLQQRTGPRPLRRRLAQDGVLLGRELRAPLLLGLLDLASR